jgi:phage/plasmid primase-like uncharacterized protein
MMTVDEVLARLPDSPEPKPIGGRWRAPCPAHGGKHLNLSVWEGEDGYARFKCFSHHCTTAEIVAALEGMPAQPCSFQPAMGNARASDQERAEWARTIWRQARPAPGTLVDDYLFGRGLIGSVPAAIRFHPALKHPSGLYFPAMVAAVEDLDGNIVAIHRTFLKPDASGKAEVEPAKMALGSVKGGAVHLSACAAELVICEGIETGLSILQATGFHVWAALGSANLGQLEMPASVCEVIIAADHDEPGIYAAIEAAGAYDRNGYLVQVVSPRTDKADWNDVLRR